MFLTDKEIKNIGFKKVGINVKISERAVFYSPENISMGDYARIDDFVIISAGTEVTIGRYVHIGCYASIIGKGIVLMQDFSGISCGVRIFSSSDPYNGNYMTNPTVPEEFRCTRHDDVILGRHVVVGANSIILPGVTLNDGVAVGAMSLVKESVGDKDAIIAGSPAKITGWRHEGMYHREEELKQQEKTIHRK